MRPTKLPNLGKAKMQGAGTEGLPRASTGRNVTIQSDVPRRAHGHAHTRGGVVARVSLRMWPARVLHSLLYVVLFLLSVRGLDRPKAFLQQPQARRLSLRGGSADSLRKIRLEALNNDLDTNERLACVGSTRELGNWDVEKAREMVRGDNDVWTTTLRVREDQEIEYKYVVLTDPKFESNLEIEKNRQLSIAGDAPKSFTVVDSLNHCDRGLAGFGHEAQALATAGMGECRFELVVEKDSHDISMIQVVGAHPGLGAWREGEGIPLERQEGSNMWVGSAQLPLGENLEYKFVVYRRDGGTDLGAQQVHNLAVPSQGGKLHVRDTIGQPAPVLETVAGTRVNSERQLSCLCQFEVTVPGAGDTTTVSLVGSHDLLGEWQLSRAIPMFRTHHDVFSASMHLPVATDLEYQYLVKSTANWDVNDRLVKMSAPLTVTRAILWKPSVDARLPPLMRVPGQGPRGGRDSLCTFRVEEVGGEVEAGSLLGIVGDCPELGNWDASKCLPMEVHKEHGRAVFTATTKVGCGSEVNYKYVILRGPCWEPHDGNRRYTIPPSVCEWQEQRRDNMRLVRRVRDVVGITATQDAAAHEAFASNVGSAEAEAVGDWAYLEPIDQSFTGTCLFKFDVEIPRLLPTDEVWICGNTDSLGRWDPSAAVKMHASAAGGGRALLRSSVVRLPGGQHVEYKYCVAASGVGVLHASYEFGANRIVTTPVHGRGAVFDRFVSPLASDSHPTPQSDDEPIAASLVTEDTEAQADYSSTSYLQHSLHTDMTQDMPLPVAELDANKPRLTLHLEVKVHGVSGDDEVYICGSDQALGGWKYENAVLLSRQGGVDGACAIWRSQVALPAGQQIKYKYVVKRRGQMCWEVGSDRTLDTQSGEESMRVNDEMYDRSGPKQCGGHADGRWLEAETQGVRQWTAQLSDGGSELADLVRDTDEFLTELKSQSVSSISDRKPFNDYVKKNRIYLTRCNSMLDRAMDDYTRDQLETRIHKLERAYDTFATNSNRSHRERILEPTPAPPSDYGRTSPVSSPLPEPGKNLWPRRASRDHGRGYSTRMRQSSTHAQAHGKTRIARKPVLNSSLRKDGIGLVQEVLPESPAYRAGLREGDVIMAMGSTDARSVAKGGSLFGVIADEVRKTAAVGAAMDITVVREHGHSSLLQLRPGRWAGEGLLGMRIRQFSDLPAAAHS